MRILTIGLVAAAAVAVTAAQPADPSRTLPAMATTKLAASLVSAKAHARHLWRDMPPTNPDGTVTAYIEIARGDRTRYEFDMARNQRAIDRIVPEKIGGYVVNYGFVPQTVSYDGDPFDALVIGPPIDGGSLVRGIIVGLFLMEDEKEHDAKVVLSRTDAAGKPLHALTAESKKEMDDFSAATRKGSQGCSRKSAAGDRFEQGRAHVTTTHAFFQKCAGRSGAACSL